MKGECCKYSILEDVFNLFEFHIVSLKFKNDLACQRLAVTTVTGYFEVGLVKSTNLF